MPPSTDLSGILFQSNQNGLKNPKEIKYNLHYDEVQGDVLWPPHA